MEGAGTWQQVADRQVPGGGGGVVREHPVHPHHVKGGKFHVGVLAHDHVIWVHLLELSRHVGGVGVPEGVHMDHQAQRVQGGHQITSPHQFPGGQVQLEDL